MTYRNAIPEPPSGPKLLVVPHNIQRLFAYAGAALEEKQTHDVHHTSKTLGVPIDLIDMEQYELPRGAVKNVLDPEDVLLLPDPTQQKKTFKNMPKREDMLVGHTFSWLRRQEYLSNNLYEPVGKQYSETARARDQAMQVQSAKEKRDHTIETQIKNIEQTFQFSKTEPVHPTKPHLKPVQIFDVFPDDHLDQIEYTYVQFLSDPAEEVLANKQFQSQLAQLTDQKERENIATSAARAALLRSYEDQLDAQFNAPARVREPELRYHGMYVQSQQAQQQANEEKAPANVVSSHPTEWVREYVRNPAPPPKANNNFFLIMTPTAVRYSRYNRRLSLRKRAKVDGNAEEEITKRPVGLTVHVAPPADHDQSAHNSNASSGKHEKMEMS
jgi:RNA polymerase II-associated factor 1